MATGNVKPDKALKEKQNKRTLMEKVLHRDKHDKRNKKDRETKVTSVDVETAAKEAVAMEPEAGGGKSKTSLMDKVFMRDKHDKHSRKERDSKGTSRDLDTVSLDGDVVASRQRSSSIMDKVFMRDRRDRMSKRDRNSKASSHNLEEVATVTAEDAAEETDSITGLLSDVTRAGSLLDKVRLRHEKVAKKERELKTSSADLDVFKSTSMGDLRYVDGSVTLRTKLDRSNSKRENRLSSSSVVKWFKHITEAAESYKGKDKPAHRRSVHKAGSSSSVNESAGEGAPQEETPREEDEDEDRQRKDSKEERMGGLLERHASSSVDSVENLEQAEVLHINQSADLIQPSEVCVSDTMVMVEQAQPVLTNQELLVEKDQLITRTIEEKQNLVAQILNVPIQDFQHVAEIATEDEGEKGARELLLAAIYQATQLTSLLNASLNLNTATSASTVTMHSSHSNGAEAQQQPVVQEPAAEVTETTEERLQGESAGSDVTSPQASGSEALTVTLPCQPVNNVASRLHQHLNQLLDVITRREEETEQLQQQLKLTTEELSRLQDASPLNHSTSQPTSRPDSFVSSASEAGEADTSTTDGAVTIPVQTDENSLLNTSSESPKLTPIVVSHVVTSEVTVDQLASLTINDPSESVMTSSPAIVTSLDEADAAGEVDTAVTSPQDDDVKHTEEMAELV